MEAPTSRISIRLLGEFHVSLGADSSAHVRFRSKTAEWLLIFLALRVGRSVTKNELVDLFWTDSDGDKQSQNLRRAISDLRQAIQDDGHAPKILISHGDRIVLDPDLVHTDVEVFKKATDAGLCGNDELANLRTAVQVYSGPLVGSSVESWLTVHRMELEERFGQSVAQLISILLRDEQHDEALRIGRQAVLAAPLREDVHVALSCAYASAGLRAEAIRQFEELEILLQDQWGESPSDKSIQTLEQALSIQPASEQTPGRPTVARESSGGAVPAGSPFYIRRECDETLALAVKHGEGTILIHGPRQVGKTSLLLRELPQGSPVAITDFQVLSKSQMSDSESFCRALAYGFTTQIGVDIDLRSLWNEWIGPNSNLHMVIEAALKSADSQVIWAIDEADRVFGCPFADDFFGLVRSWHNLRAMRPNGPFAKLTMVISYATEAHLFIQDINQSPFNVGVRVPMRDFDEVETIELARRYGLKLSHRQGTKLKSITGGQPFLTRKALDTMVHGGSTLEELAQRASGEDGPFSEHLRRLLAVASKDEATMHEIVRFLKGQPFQDPTTPWRLQAGGMLVRDSSGRLDFRAPAYRDFLMRYLVG